MEKQHELCGCGGTGKPVSERPLYQLANLIAALERRAEEQKKGERHDFPPRQPAG
jgi:hypothetical protein